MHESAPAARFDPSKPFVHFPMVSQRWSSLMIRTKFG
jgi:hypothetical protein